MTRKDNKILIIGAVGVLIFSVGVAILTTYWLRNTSFYYHPVTKAERYELADWNLIIKLLPLSGVYITYLLFKKYFKHDLK